MKAMTRKDIRRLQTRRFAFASVIVLAFILAPQCVAWAQDIAQVSLTDIFISSLLDPDSSGGSDTVLADGLACSSASETFREKIGQELFDISAYEASQIDEGAGLLGFESNEDPAAELEALQTVLAEKGWCLSGTNDSGVYVFTKSTGAYTWCYVSATRVSAKTIVVIKVQ